LHGFAQQTGHVANQGVKYLRTSVSINMCKLFRDVLHVFIDYIPVCPFYIILLPIKCSIVGLTVYQIVKDFRF